MGRHPLISQRLVEGQGGSTCHNFIMMRAGKDHCNILETQKWIRFLVLGGKDYKTLEFLNTPRQMMN